MTWPGDVVRHRVRETALWVGAALGVLCLLLAAVAWIFDIRPLVFRSGSMSPEIEAGALALAQDVPASELREGDVVSVETGDAVRVTHRIVGIDRSGNSANLTLRGDANSAPDQQPHRVDSAYRVFVDVPWAGHVVNAASTPWGLLLCGGFVALLLVSAFGGGGGRSGGRHSDDSDQSDPEKRKGLGVLARRATGVAGPTLLVVAGAVMAPMGTMATWSDTSVVRSGSMTALTVPAPTNSQCVTGLNATVSWTSAGPNYSYFVTATRVSDGHVAYSGYQTGTSITFTTGLLGNLLSTNFVARIRAVPTGANAWQSAGSVTSNFRSRTLGLGTSCGHF